MSLDLPDHLRREREAQRAEQAALREQLDSFTVMFAVNLSDRRLERTDAIRENMELARANAWCLLEAMGMLQGDVQDFIDADRKNRQKLRAGT